MRSGNASAPGTICDRSAAHRPGRRIRRLGYDGAGKRLGRAIGQVGARWLRSRRRATRLTTLFHRTNTPRAKIGAEDETPAPAGPRSAGDVLRQQRAALGLDLGEVAKELRIKPVYLAALEEGRPDRLPGPAYAIGYFCGSMAIIWGSTAGRSCAASGSRPRGSTLNPTSRSRCRWASAAYLAGRRCWWRLVLTICGYASWYYLATGEHSRPERVTEVPANLLLSNSALPSNWAKPATAPITGPAAPAAPTLSATPSTSPAPSPVQPSSTRRPPPPLVGAAPARDRGCFAVACSRQQPGCSGRRSTGSQSAAPSAYGTVGVPARIVLRATADSWIQVRDADHRVLFSGVLKAGQSYPVPDQPGLSMRAGNAGGLDVTVDGKPAASLGPTRRCAQYRARSAIAGGDDHGPELSAARLPASFVRRRNDLYACSERSPERGR